MVPGLNLLLHFRPSVPPKVAVMDEKFIRKHFSHKDLRQRRRLVLDVQRFNEYRQKNPSTRIELIRLDLTRCELRGANLRGASCWRTIFDKSDCRGVDFTGADLAYAKFKQCNLQHATFRGAGLTRAEFDEADFRKAVLTGALAHGARFDGADLREADISKLDIDATSFWKARLRPEQQEHILSHFKNSFRS